jgi:hypothetical protein
MISKSVKSKQSNPADFAFNPNSEQEDVGEVQAFHLLLMLLRLLIVTARYSLNPKC